MAASIVKMTAVS